MEPVGEGVGVGLGQRQDGGREVSAVVGAAGSATSVVPAALVVAGLDGASLPRHAGECARHRASPASGAAPVALLSQSVHRHVARGL